MRRHRPVRAALLLLAAILLSTAPGYGQETAGQPTTCRIGVNIEDIYDIDIARDTFGAALWLWTLCPTDGVDPLATVAFPTATSVNLGELASVPTGGAGYYRYLRLQGTFRYDWDMTHYPFDRHRVVIPIDETHLAAEIVLFEVEGNYARAYFASNRPLIRASLNALEARLDPALFFRASRQHIVNLRFIESVETSAEDTYVIRLKNKRVVPVSRRQSRQLRESLGF